MVDNIICGTPPMLMLPASNYTCKIDENHYIIELPRTGSYHDLAPEIFDAEAGEFNVFDEKTKTLYLPSITKLLFATSKYPKLNYNQFFIPYVVRFEEEKVVIVGQIISMVHPSKRNNGEK